MTIDPRAASGFAGVAEDYERGRPSYPPAAIDRIADHLGLTTASTVLDLAAGTGQLSILLQPRVGRIIAVEPAAAMRERIEARLPQARVLDGTAEAIPLDDREVDAVVVGEAFHWFQTQAAAEEIARVLMPQGGIALLWNTPTWTVETTPWLEDFRAVVARHKRAAGEYPAGAATWRPKLERTGLFDDLTHVELAHAQTLDQAGFLAQVRSWSWVANLEHVRREAVLEQVRKLVQHHVEIVIPYRTDLHLARLRERPRARSA